MKCVSHVNQCPYRNRQHGTLVIDGRRVSEGRSRGPCTVLNVNGPVYIGKTVTLQ
jgi:hypothetical protein